jgi:ubiquinone biosynthesis UbiH/UbiF/VisC/COQ6 family hydroxylase
MKYDITIIGAGPAGLSFARSLASTDLKVVMVEKLPKAALSNPAFDGRDIALTHKSVKILRALGAWSRTHTDAIYPIREARVLDGTSPYFLSFDSKKDSVEALGYIVSNHLIRKALYEEVEAVANVDIFSDLTVTSVVTNTDNAIVILSNGESIESSLVVAADSRFSETRRMMGIPAAMQDFGRSAIVCRMEHERPHNGIAFECFHYGRTLAVLPLSEKQSSIVITAPTNVAEAVSTMSNEQLTADVQLRFENRLGKMKLVSKVHLYPLVAVHADNFVTTRFALLGDAAVGMHPVTAHGFNLGLSGQDILAKEIKNAVSQRRDIGGSKLLNNYQSRHMRTTKPLYLGTNRIVGLFTNDTLPIKVLRKTALRITNNFAPVKWLIKNMLTETEHSPTALPPLPRWFR